MMTAAMTAIEPREDGRTATHRCMTGGRPGLNAKLLAGPRALEVVGLDWALVDDIAAAHRRAHGPRLSHPYLGDRIMPSSSVNRRQRHRKPASGGFHTPVLSKPARSYRCSRDQLDVAYWAMSRRPRPGARMAAVRWSPAVRAAHVRFPAVSAASPSAADMAATWPGRQYLTRSRRQVVRSSERCGADGAISKSGGREQIGGLSIVHLVVPRSAPTALRGRPGYRSLWLASSGWSATSRRSKPTTSTLPSCAHGARTT